MSALYCNHGRQLVSCAECAPEMERLFKANRAQWQRKMDELQDAAGDIVTIEFRCSCGELLSHNFIVEESVYGQKGVDLDLVAEPKCACPNCKRVVSQVRINKKAN